MSPAVVKGNPLAMEREIQRQREMGAREKEGFFPLVSGRKREKVCGQNLVTVLGRT